MTIRGASGIRHPYFHRRCEAIWRLNQSDAAVKRLYDALNYVESHPHPRPERTIIVGRRKQRIEDLALQRRGNANAAVHHLEDVTAVFLRRLDTNAPLSAFLPREHGLERVRVKVQHDAAIDAHWHPRCLQGCPDFDIDVNMSRFGEVVE